MATLVLGAVGSVFGPLGGAIGTLLGRTIDGKIFGSGGREGPRLKELTISGSSYGTPIPRHFGTMRTPGTIIWSSDLSEHRHNEGGGKGQPRAVHFSYSVSCAIALASRPIDGVGRIWADGNLLRGRAGDLKAAGALRIHRGLGDQAPDPLLHAVLGEECPAFRGTAYVVFEDLELTDFGNRIPALSFEVFSGDGAAFISDLLGPVADLDPGLRFPALGGYSHEGGSLNDIATLIDRLQPLDPLLDGDRLWIGRSKPEPFGPVTLPPAARWDDGEFGRQSGQAGARSGAERAGFAALRYYDVDRDYQAGLQTTPGYAPDQRVFEFPGAFAASHARTLARDAQQRNATQTETLSWRCADIDPAIVPGALVRVPGESGTWRVTGWEWREYRVELELQRYRPPLASALAAAPGSHWSPPDRIAAATNLLLHELPWDGAGAANERRIHAAIAGRPGRWAGAALYAIEQGALVPTGDGLTTMATTGALQNALGRSTGLRLEEHVRLTVRLDDPARMLVPCDPTGLAQGRNRALVGSEIIQFANAEPSGDGLWTLTGLLRGRGGTEPQAASGQPAGTRFLLLDDDLHLLSAKAAAMANGEGYAAIGPGDDRPSQAAVANRDASLAPPSPVHAGFYRTAEGALVLRWARRARGGWLWRDAVAQPLVEEQEQYEIGRGDPAAPGFARRCATPRLVIPAAEVAAFGSPEGLWVRQVGTFAPSAACRFTHRPPTTSKD